MRSNGVFIAQVENESPAAEAGIQDGDVIDKLDGEAVPTVEVLRSKIQRKKPGDPLEVEFLQDGRRRRARVRLRERETEIRR